MKKSLSILFVLVLLLSFSLVTAVPATPVMATANPTTYYVATTGNNTSGNGTAGNPWLTMTYAISQVNSGDTIIVAAGTYTETVDITKSITLQSDTGTYATSGTIITGASSFTPHANGVTIKGFRFESTTVNSPINGNATPAKTGVTIQANKFINMGADVAQVINVGGAGNNDWTITGNYINGVANAAASGVWVGGSSGWTITNNTIMNTGFDGMVFVGTTTANVTGNTINGTANAGMEIDPSVNGITIYGNTITNTNTSNTTNMGAISVYVGATNVAITRNIITANYNGVTVANSGSIASSVTVQYNNIYSNRSYGVKGVTPAYLNALYNWWGSASGPTHSGNTFNSGSQGDAVTNFVTYVPWLNAAYATGTSFAPVKNISDSPVSNFSSIQAAIDASTTVSGEIITCEAGSYNGTGESFPIDITKGITLKSVAGAATTIINGGALQAIAIATDNVTLGATGYGFTIKGGGSSTAVIITNGGATSGITIQGNIIRRNNRGQNDGIYVNSATSMTIDNNSFYGDQLWTSSTTDADIEGGPGTAIVVDTTSGAASLTVKNNIAYNLKYTFLSIVGNVDGVVVYGNTLHDLRQYAIDFYTRYNTITIGSNGVNIYKNTIYNNGDGIHIGYSNFALTGVGNIAINFNDIYSNNNTNGGKANKGVENIYTAAVNALYNYWGDASGPTIAANARGAGDALSANVTYQPWLTTTQATVYPSGIRYYGYNWCSLTPGWNVWSTPIALDPQADTWGEYKALGIDLALATGANAYSFNGTSQTWASVTDSYVLTPCDAIYINMASAQTSPILFSPIISAPSKVLSAGWNLVSASYIDSINSPTITNGVAPETALASIYYVTGANNIGYGQVVSPAAGQPAWSSVRGPAIDTPTSKIMYPCKGYWVYMTNAGTLAGTVFTPVSPLLPSVD